MTDKEMAGPPAKEPKKEADNREQDALAAKGGARTRLVVIVVAALAIGMAVAAAALKFPGESTPSAAIETASSREVLNPVGPPPIKTTEKSGVENTGLSISGVDQEGREAVGTDPGPPNPVNIEFEPLVVNLPDDDGRRFLKLNLSVEAESEALREEINSKIPAIRHTILLLLSGLSDDDLATMDGKMKLRRQLLGQVNSQLTSGQIKNIYFSELVVQ